MIKLHSVERLKTTELDMLLVNIKMVVDSLKKENTDAEQVVVDLQVCRRCVAGWSLLDRWKLLISDRNSCLYIHDRSSRIMKSLVYFRWNYLQIMNWTELLRKWPAQCFYFSFPQNPLWLLASGRSGSQYKIRSFI